MTAVYEWKSHMRWAENELEIVVAVEIFSQHRNTNMEREKSIFFLAMQYFPS